MSDAPAGIACPDCGSPTRHIVKDSRRTHGAIWRRRGCEGCGRAFSTLEVPTVRDGRECVPTGERLRGPTLLANASIDELFAELKRRYETRDGGE